MHIIIYIYIIIYTIYIYNNIHIIIYMIYIYAYIYICIYIYNIYAYIYIHIYGLRKNTVKAKLSVLHKYANML